MDLRYYLISYKIVEQNRLTEGNIDIKSQGPLSVSDIPHVKIGIQKLFPDIKPNQIIILNIMELAKPKNQN